MREIFFMSIITQSKKKLNHHHITKIFTIQIIISIFKSPPAVSDLPNVHGYFSWKTSSPAHNSHWLLNLYPVNLFHHNFHHNHHVNINIIVIIIIFMIITSSSPSWSWWLSSSQLFLNLHCTHSPLSLVPILHFQSANRLNQHHLQPFSWLVFIIIHHNFQSANHLNLHFFHCFVLS